MNYEIMVMIDQFFLLFDSIMVFAFIIYYRGSIINFTSSFKKYHLYT